MWLYGYAINLNTIVTEYNHAPFMDETCIRISVSRDNNFTL
jgi:hypothetical protein